MWTAPSLHSVGVLWLLTLLARGRQKVVALHRQTK